MENHLTSFGLARPNTRPDRAFTRLDLMAVLAGMAVLTAVAWPVLANTRPRSERITCLNNLRQIGLGFRTYAGAHEDLFPWLISPPEGIRGPRTTRAQNAYDCFVPASNELASPKILVCPTDKLTPVIAIDFSIVPQKGLGWAGFQNFAVSYFAGLDTSTALPNTLLAGDHNIRPLPIQNCGTVFVTARTLVYNDPSLGWTNGVHEYQGNLLRADGVVLQLTSEELRAAVRGSGDANSNNHITTPK